MGKAHPQNAFDAPQVLSKSEAQTLTSAVIEGEDVKSSI